MAAGGKSTTSSSSSSSSRIAPLTNSQKLFLQRLLVMHVLTDDEARKLYSSIQSRFKDVIPPPSSQEDDDDEGGRGGEDVDHGYLGNDLDHLLGIINSSLVPAFDLEVRTVLLPPPYREDDGENENDDVEEGGRGRQRRGGGGGGTSAANNNLVKYHAIANRIDDDASRNHAFPIAMGGPHEMAYFRMAIEKMIERGNEVVEASGGGGRGGIWNVGCPGTMNKMELINLRTEMDGAHSDKLTIGNTEDALGTLIEGGWLVRVSPPGDDDIEDDVDIDDDDDDGATGGRSTGKRGRRSGDNNNNKKKKKRRSSLKGTYYGIGPRSFVELGEFLQKAGFPGERMPQSLLHRV